MSAYPPKIVVVLLCLFGNPAWFALAGDNQQDDEYQLNLNPHHPVTDELSAFGNFGATAAADYTRYRFGWPGLIYNCNVWLQLWGGLDAYYTVNDFSADQLELRPFAGVKLFVPNRAKLQLYNFTRYEYRDFEDMDTHQWSGYGRIRSRFGAEVPLTSQVNAWQLKTFYLLADAEPFYRFDRNEWDPVRVRGGLGYIVNDHLRVELIYTAQFTRSSPGSSLAYDNNIIQLNFRIGFQKDALARLFNPGS